MSLAFVIFVEFIKTGMFAIGGGLATLPFLYHIGHAHAWYSAKDLSQMLAVASIVPGPIGINLASYAGFTIKGFWGALIAVSGIMIPSLASVILLSKVLKHFRENQFVKSMLYVLKPTGCAMIAAVGFRLFRDAIFKSFTLHHISIDYAALVLLIVLMIISAKSGEKQKGPLFYLGFSAVVGVFIGLIKPLFFG